MFRPFAANGGMRRAFRARSVATTQRRKFGASGGEPHVPEGYDALSKVMLVSCYLWIMYRLKEDKGQLFGMYKPWEHPHEHGHAKWVKGGTDGNLILAVDYDGTPTGNAPEEDEDDEH